MSSYAKVIVNGSPITKSNFKLHNVNGRAILPYNSGQYHDRYALYEQEIAYIARSQNPEIVLTESLIAILKVYYKSEKRHPDTINICKSIFDGVEKSGLIVNDAQVRRIVIEEFYDKENPRFELELFGESEYSLTYSVIPKETSTQKNEYKPLRKNFHEKSVANLNEKTIKSDKICSMCKKSITCNDFITADKGKPLICKNCFKKLF